MTAAVRYTTLAYKAELRSEIAQLRSIGSQMANLCFNIGQHARLRSDGKTISKDDLAIMYELSKKWDAIKRAEKVA